MRRTNPIWTGRTRGGRTGVSSVELQASGQESPLSRPLTSNFKPRTSHFPPEIVQNEAKLGVTGVWGQRRSPCGTWLGRGVKRAKRTQFGAGWDGPRGRGPSGRYAKRTQFGPRAQEWARAGGPGWSAGGRLYKTNPIWPGRRVNAQNEPNLARPEGKCAKRTQSRPAGGQV
jgi:hypothetical protein